MKRIPGSAILTIAAVTAAGTALAMSRPDEVEVERLRHQIMHIDGQLPKWCSVWQIRTQRNVFHQIKCEDRRGVLIAARQKIYDFGYPNTQKWEDNDGDKIDDFCRVVGNRPHLQLGCYRAPFFKNQFYRDAKTDEVK